MSRCQHCHKLTHSEHLDVYFDQESIEKVQEIERMQGWTHAHMYDAHDKRRDNAAEFGKIKVGDIIVHFIVKKPES